MGLHAENGFLKIFPKKIEENTMKFKAELMLSHPFGVNELYSNCIFDMNNNTLVCEALGPECF